LIGVAHRAGLIAGWPTPTGAPDLRNSAAMVGGARHLDDHQPSERRGRAAADRNDRVVAASAALFLVLLASTILYATAPAAHVARLMTGPAEIDWEDAPSSAGGRTALPCRFSTDRPWHRLGFCLRGDQG
jgi:hypothetical protein